MNDANVALEVCNKHVAANSEAEKKNFAAPSKPLNPNTKKAMNRAPNNAKLDNPFLQCMCCNSHSAQQGTDMGSSCAINCTDTATGLRYPFVRSTCFCLMCRCQCSKAYNICDLRKMGL